MDADQRRQNDEHPEGKGGERKLLRRAWESGTPGSSALRNPPPKSTYVGGGAQGVSGSNSPNRIPNSGVQGEPCTVRYWSTCYIRLGATRTTRAPCHCLDLRALLRGRDECPSSKGEHSSRSFVPIFHSVYGVGGLLKKPPMVHRVHCCYQSSSQPRKLSVTR